MCILVPDCKDWGKCSEVFPPSWFRVGDGSCLGSLDISMPCREQTWLLNKVCGVGHCSPPGFFSSWKYCGPHSAQYYSLHLSIKAGLGYLRNLQPPMTPASIRDCQHIWNVLSGKKDNLVPVCKSRPDLLQMFIKKQITSLILAKLLNPKWDRYLIAECRLLLSLDSCLFFTTGKFRLGEAHTFMSEAKLSFLHFL